MQPITDKQREALRTLAMRDASPFDFGSTTVNVLCNHGYAERVRVSEGRALYTSAVTRLRITEAGRALV